MVAFILFLIVLSVLVLIHELGHFLAARLFGVKAEEFGYGFPPRIFGFVKEGKKWKFVSGRDNKTYANTIWSVNWLPLGGFVRIKGETSDGVNAPDSIQAKPIWQRLVIMAAGVAMNWLLAVLILTCVYAVGTTVSSTSLPNGAHATNPRVEVTDVLDGSAAATAGIQPGDDIIQINGKSEASADAAQADIKTQGSNSFSIQIQRGSSFMTLSVTPTMVKELGHPGLGVALDTVSTVSFSWPRAFVVAIETVWNMTVLILVTFWQIIHDLFTVHAVTTQVAGPVGIAVMTGQVAKLGIIALLQFAAVLSVNLAVINFLPIPALDGGRALFLIIEAIRGKPFNRILEIWINDIVFILLIILILVVTAHDISQLHLALP